MSDLAQIFMMDLKKHVYTFYRLKWNNWKSSEQMNSRSMWIQITSHPNTTMKDIEDHPDLPWVYRTVYTNPNLTMDFVLKRMEFLESEMNTMSDQENTISMNDNVQEWKQLQATAPNGSVWSHISCNPGITMKDILDHPELPWDWDFVPRNPNATIQFVLDHPYKPWCWSSVSKLPSVTMQTVLDHPDIPWVWKELARNPGITMKDMEDNIDKPWDWTYVVQNPNMSISFLTRSESRIRLKPTYSGLFV